MPIELYFKNRMEPHNNTSEERKRRAFMNALQNLGLMKMIEEEEKTEINEIPKKQISLVPVLFLIPHQPHTTTAAFVGGDGMIEEAVAETDDYGLKPVMTSF